MNNTELEQKLKELITTPNYFDYILKMREFEVEYKKSDFYKATKKPLKEVLLECRFHYFFNFDGIGSRMQDLINSLSLEHLQDLIEQIGETFGEENAQILETAELLKNLK